MMGGSKLYSGVSLHIGLNRVDPRAYGGWDGLLSGCVNDAKAMKSVAALNGFDSTTLLNEKATRPAVVRAIETIRSMVMPGDVFLLTYSGHGGQVPDPHGDEADHLDETWCLYDGELIDDELWDLFCKFRPKSRIIVVSDSCHSGTMVRGRPGRKPRMLPASQVGKAYAAQKKHYDAVPRLGREKYDCKASVCLMSGCQDNQTSADGERYGLFTETLLEVYGNGSFAGDYWRFNREILRRMPQSQSPNLLFVGLPNVYFEWSRPFSIR